MLYLESVIVHTYMSETEGKKWYIQVYHQQVVSEACDK